MGSRCSAAEGFDDVDIDSLGELPSKQYTSQNSSLSYLYKKNKSVIQINESNNRSTTSLMNNNSHDQLPQRYGSQKPLPQQPNVAIMNVSREEQKTSSTPQTVNTSSNAQQMIVKPNYSPSKKLHKKRQIPKDDEYQMYDNDSEDDLDDTILIYDVPLSQSLVQLTTHQKPIQHPPPPPPPQQQQQSSLLSPSTSTARLHSLGSDTTHTSSIMSTSQYSLNSSISENEETFSFIDPKTIGLEMSRSKSVLTIQESTMRRHLISNFDNLRPKSMDPNIPISEIKEKFLTPTRQFDLPPKSKNEAIKHLKEFQEIKTKAIKNEFKNEKFTLKEISKRKSQQLKDLNIWERKIIPNFHQQVQLSETRELWWRGIPFKLRQFIWMEQIGVKLPLNYFQNLKIKAQELLNLKNDNDNENDDFINQINQDIKTLFPDVLIFQTTKFKDLQLLIIIYSIHANYEPNLNSLIAVLLYNINDLESTFSCLLGLLQRNVLKLLINKDIIGFNIESNSFLRTFAKKQPELYHHLNLNLKLSPYEYLEPLIKPIFSKHLSIDIVSCIIDVYIFEGDSILWRCILGLFKKIGFKLFGNKQEISNVIGWDALQKINKGEKEWIRYLDVGDDVEFMNVVREVLKKS